MVCFSSVILYNKLFEDTLLLIKTMLNFYIIFDIIKKTASINI